MRFLAYNDLGVSLLFLRGSLSIDRLCTKKNFSDCLFPVLRSCPYVLLWFVISVFCSFVIFHNFHTFLGFNGSKEK